MKTLLILYLVYLSWGTAGQGRVSLLEMSRYLRNSKTTMRKIAFALADDGLIDVIETFTDKGSKKLYMQLTETGEAYLMQNFDAAYGQYQVHVAETIEAMKAKYAQGEFVPRKLSKKQRETYIAGQKEMFPND